MVRATDPFAGEIDTILPKVAWPQNLAENYQISQHLSIILILTYCLTDNEFFYISCIRQKLTLLSGRFIAGHYNSTQNIFCQARALSTDHPYLDVLLQTKRNNESENFLI